MLNFFVFVEPPFKILNPNLKLFCTIQMIALLHYPNYKNDKHLMREGAIAFNDAAVLFVQLLNHRVKDRCLSC